MNCTGQCHVSQVLRIELCLWIGGRAHVERPDGGSDWGIQFTVILFIFPKGK